MRYSRLALLIFGAGAVLGLALVSADLTGLGRLAAAAMAAGLALLPFALVADWWSHRPWRAPQPRRRTRAPRKPKSSPSRRRGTGRG